MTADTGSVMGDEATAGSVEVGADQHRARADKALAAHLEEFSRTQLQRLFALGRVWRDEVALNKSDKVSAGDIITFSIPAPKPLELRAVPIALEVLFEDNDIVAINKMPGMVVHPGAGTGEDTLVHALLHHCHGQLSGIGGVERPGIVHRLDRETSGVIIVAKSDRAFRALSEAFANRSLEKHYTAIVRGVPTKSHGRVDAPIGRHAVQRTRMCVRDDGRSAQTDWRVREKFLCRGFASLDLRIHTGRTHQIRVHCAFLGHPVAGDGTYGFRPRSADPGVFPRVMLHAERLLLTHPVSGEPLELRAPLPPDLAGALEELRQGEST